MERKPALLTTVAVANKIACVVWAVLARGQIYQPVAIAS
jgi:hypothetical protein